MPQPPPPPIRLTPAQEAALARVRFAFEAPAGIVLLCGPAGAGTTLLLAELARSLDTRGDNAPGSRWIRSVPEVVAAARAGTPLPDILLVDEVHHAAAGELAVVAGSLAGGAGDKAGMGLRPRCIVLAGRGRLLTLVARDSQIATRVRLRAIVPPFTLDDTCRFVIDRLTGLDGAGPEEGVVRTIHEITGGIPAALERLVALAAATTGSGRRLSVEDVETIHRRLDPRAV